MGAPTYRMDEGLLPFATEKQAAYLRAINEHQSKRGAARALGVNYSVVHDAMRLLQKKAALMGWSPDHDMTKTVPEPFVVKGVSTYYNKEGKAAGQWVKSSLRDGMAEEVVRAFAETLSEDVKGRAPITQKPAHGLDDILCVYPWGDPHFGCYSWWQEAGADFDLNIAERLTCGAVDRLVASAPPAKTGLLLNLGDMYHADTQNNTSRSGHQLDVDGRWAKVQQVGLRAMIHCIFRMLEKHERVIVRINRGNHDDHTSYALALMLSCYYHSEPRVEVDLSPAVMWYFQFGKVLIASTHGDKIKGPDLLQVVAADKPEAWGATTHRHVYVGHVHHQDTKEYRGGVVEYFRTLAARDAWHTGQGYRAGRDMCLIVHHAEFGEVERHRCDVAMIER